MFQIEPILWLHSFDSPAVTWVLSAVSLMGYTPVFVALIIVLVFGLRLRRGLAVLLALLLAGTAIDGLKNGLALPRPSHIDARAMPAGFIASPIVDGGGATSFWALPAPAAIAAVRGQPDVSYGFPSGHVASAAAFCFGLALLFRSRAVLLFGVGWVPLMAVSRMYLGRHFLADVIGGFAVGVAAVAAAALLLRRIVVESPGEPNMRALLPLAAVGLALLVATPLVPSLDAEQTGRLVGVLLACALILLRGLPADRGSVGRRAARVVTAVLVYLVTSQVVGVLLDASGWADTRFGDATAALVLTSATLAGTVELSRRLRCYEPVA